ncbi:hypothetical protein H4CHR_03063 [Variovorax sp. PBS-H4]|nr:hypothetical protein H4CHR_03063 [Variovorax sp. PBS-H4]
MDLPASVVRAHAMKCTTSEPPTSRLILPPGLKNVPVWIAEFKATLGQVTAHHFVGSEQTIRTDLKFFWPDSKTTWDLSPGATENAAKPSATLDMERQLDVQTVLSNNALRAVARPYIGELDESARAGLECFMDQVRDASPFDPKKGIDYNLGGFKMVRSHSGELELLKLATPPYAEPDFDPDSLHARALPKAIEVFDALHGTVQVAVWQAMSKYGIVDYFKGHATQLIDGPWDILVNINPYFSRSPKAIEAHRDTEGENMFLMLFYCKAGMGIEYQLRHKNPKGYLQYMRQHLPSVFVDEVEDVLKEPADGVAYAPTIEPWNFIAGCDETMVHSTPFLHHRGAFFLKSVLNQMDASLEDCSAAWTAEEYCGRVLPAAGKVREQLKDVMSSDDCVDRGELERLLRVAGLTAPEAAKIVETLAPSMRTKDPFDGTAGVGIPGFHEAKVPRGKKLHRQMSDRLDAGTALPNAGPRDYMRVWIMARRKQE